MFLFISPLLKRQAGSFRASNLGGGKKDQTCAKAGEVEGKGGWGRCCFAAAGRKALIPVQERAGRIHPAGEGEG